MAERPPRPKGPRRPRAKKPARPGRPEAPARQQKQERQALLASLPASVSRALGAAIYTTDVALPKMLHVAVSRCPHPRATVKSAEVEAARKAPGVRAVQLLRVVGSETTRFGEEVALVAADSENQALEARRLVRFEFEALPATALVPGPTAPADDAFAPAETVGTPTEALAAAAFRSKGSYGWERQTLAEWEPRAFVCEPTGDALHVWAGSEDPARLAADLAAALSLPAEKVRVVAAHVGASFGSRASLLPVEAEVAKLARQLGAPLRLVFDRTAEVLIGGHREAGYGEVELGADKDGKVTVGASKVWGAASPALPLFAPPNRSARRPAMPSAPADPAAGAPRGAAEEGAAYLHACALDDLAAQMGQSPLDVLLLNAPLTEPLGVRVHALLKETESHSGWKARWHPRGDPAEGPVKRGLGLGFGAWTEPPGAALGTGTALAFAVAEVAVDRQTGIVTMEKVVVIGEGGGVPEGAEGATPIPAADLRLLDGELSRGAVQGVSQALFEAGESGRFAAVGEAGEVTVRLVPTGFGKVGSGAAVAARFAAPAAVANAVANALGQRIAILPLTPERVAAVTAPAPPPPPAAPPAPAPAAPEAPAPLPSVGAPGGTGLVPLPVPPRAPLAPIAPILPASTPPTAAPPAPIAPIDPPKGRK